MEERFAISMMRLGAARRADSDVIDNPPLLVAKRSRTSAGSAETLDTNSITNTRGIDIEQRDRFGFLIALFYAVW